MSLLFRDIIGVLMKISIEKKSGTPLYRQICRQVREQILSGQLPPGFRLPPERRLAAALGVTRTTVVTAYDELKAEGLVDARVGRGTVVVSPKHPERPAETARSIPWLHLFHDEGLRPPDPLVRNLLEMSMRPGVTSFAVGLPSPDHLPVEEVREITLRLFSSVGPQLLLQTPTEGLPPFREALSRWLTTRGIVCSSEEVLVLSGSQQGLQLTARIFVNPGDTVVVEAPTYFGALEAFRRAGARLVDVPVDNDGMQVDVLASLLRHHRPRLLYVLPTFQNPSGTVLSLERRRQLLQLAGRNGIPVLEDDTYVELRYSGAHVPSLKALDTAGIVLSLGTFSKMVFPGLRLGWLVAPRPVIRRLALAKQTEDLHSSTIGQWIMHEMLQSGALERHLTHMRDVYRDKRDVMQAALMADRVDGMRWDLPEGGFYFWCELPRAVDRARLSALAAERGVTFLLGHACFAEEPSANCIRLNFSFPSREEISVGIPRLMEAIRHICSARRPTWDRSDAAMQPIV